MPCFVSEEIMSKTKNINSQSLFIRVMSHCMPIEILATLAYLIPVVISLIIRYFSQKLAADFIFNYIAIPLALIAPVLVTVKQIKTLKASFPRESEDSHKVILSILSCTAISFILLEISFFITCQIYSIFPFDFYIASYVRDMFLSSIPAMLLCSATIFFAYLLISMMITTSYFYGESLYKNYSFTISCVSFSVVYFIFLIIFILSYFAATFVDVTALENIQIKNSFFNSSILCAFVIFNTLSCITIPILYYANYKSLKKLKIKKI